MFGRHSAMLSPSNDENIDTQGHPDMNCPKKHFMSRLRVLAPKKPIPPPPPSQALLCTTLDPMRTAIELSNYPPTLTKLDVRALFNDFHVADFKLPSARSFSVPLRVRIEIAGKGEAARAVKELNGLFIQRRRIGVKLLEAENYKEKEVLFEEIADEMKVGIIAAARVYHERFAEKLLFVREWMTANMYYAFLQAREPINQESSAEVIEDAEQNLAYWQLLAAGTANTNDPQGRLEALKNLKKIIEDQGQAFQAWEEWEGSQMLHYDF